MNKVYNSAIAILVIIVALLSISILNKRDTDSKVQSTNLNNEINQENNMNNQNMSDENTNTNENENITRSQNTGGNGDGNTNEVIERREQENGLVIEILAQGSGASAESGKTVAVHYTGTLEDGTVFDSSVQRGTPIEFALGTGQVIRGWDEGVVGMEIGEKRRLTIPADLGYGDRGVTLSDGTVLIPGGATLIFDVELVSIK